MATAIEIITRSLRLAKAIGTGEALTGPEATDGLVVLNTLLQAWSLERLLVYQVLRTTHVLTAGDGNYTVGSGGNINIARPIHLEDTSYLTLNGIDYPLVLINEAGYQGLAYKIQQGVPEWLWYDPKFPLAEINLYPVPNQGYTLNLASWTPLQTFATLTDSLSLPPGYQRMIEYNLAVEFGMEFQTDVPPLVLKIAGDTKAVVKRINAPNYVLKPESVHISPRRASFQIYRG